VGEPAISELRLTLERGAEPIRGSLGAEGERGREFEGWLELASAIDAARGEGAPAPRERGSGEGP
jgi:hypothetical protein